MYKMDFNSMKYTRLYIYSNIDINKQMLRVLGQGRKDIILDLFEFIDN